MIIDPFQGANPSVAIEGVDVFHILGGQFKARTVQVADDATLGHRFRNHNNSSLSLKSNIDVRTMQFRRIGGFFT